MTILHRQVEEYKLQIELQAARECETDRSVPAGFAALKKSIADHVTEARDTERYTKLGLERPVLEPISQETIDAEGTRMYKKKPSM